MDPYFEEDDRGVITEFWIECAECRLRVNIFDRQPDCGCETRFWLVVPELTKRAPVADLV